MRQTKNQNDLGSSPSAKIIQELQPNKICKCGACQPRKLKLPKGQRRLTVSSKLVVHQQAWVKEDTLYDYVPKIWLEGKWLRETGFESGQHIIITTEKGKLLFILRKNNRFINCRH